jgi:hypothetical protein
MVHLGVYLHQCHLESMLLQTVVLTIQHWMFSKVCAFRDFMVFLAVRRHTSLSGWHFRDVRILCSMKYLRGWNMFCVSVLCVAPKAQKSLLACITDRVHAEIYLSPGVRGFGCHLVFIRYGVCLGRIHVLTAKICYRVVI